MQVISRFAVILRVWNSRWAKRLFVLWGVIAFYDTFVSQLVPADLAQHAPKVSKLIELSTGLLPWWGWLLTLLVLLNILLLEYIYRRLQTDQIIRTEMSKDKHIQEDVFLPLKEAANRAYEQLIDTLWGAAAERFGRDLGPSRAEGVLTYFATALNTRKIPIYGKRPPSRNREEVDPGEFKRGGFRDWGNTFARYGEKDPFYVDLEVKESDLVATIEKMKNDQF